MDPFDSIFDSTFRFYVNDSTVGERLHSARPVSSE
jgi:hypothetical protein